MNRIKRFIVPTVCVSLLMCYGAFASKNNQKVNNYENTAVLTSSLKSPNVNNTADNKEKKIPNIKVKETEIKDRDKIQKQTPFKIESPSLDLEDLKETQHTLTVIDYTIEDQSIPEDIPSNHRITTIYKGNDNRSLMITQLEETTRPADLLNECEKVKLKDVDAYVYNPTNNKGTKGVIQVMFWKDGKYYNIMGKDIGKEKLLKIAETLS